MAGRASIGWLRNALACAASCWALSGWMRCAHAVDCAPARHGDVPYTTCRVDLAVDRLGIFYAAADGTRYASFERLASSLARARQTLVFAVNGGMFHPDMKPVGLLIVDGRQLAPLNRAQRAGNFFLQPNGVFLVDAAGARVVATDDYGHRAPRFATQSGPMLVHLGQIPATAAFSAGSRSRHIRNGVCAPDAAHAVFVISETRVTLHEFAAYFRDVLGCTEALYLDGSISSLYSRALGRADARAELGPIIAVTQ